MKGTLRQILLVTDGCSNQGENPVAMAALAREQGITVNVIGILEEYDESGNGLREIDDIAKAGGGISQLVYAKQLSQTVQMVTRKAMNQTIQGIVNKELKQILGSGKMITDLEPQKRGEVLEVVDEMGETMSLEVLVLIDTSGSMENKLAAVKEALIDLSISLNSRIGDNLFALSIFPGKNVEVEELLSWTPKLERISSVFPKLTSGGITPTGPAIREAINQFQQRRSHKKGMLGNDDSYEISG
ncbi:MAG: VWA domain-containing protein [Bacillaceae bacterium]